MTGYVQQTRMKRAEYRLHPKVMMQPTHFGTVVLMAV